MILTNCWRPDTQRLETVLSNMRCESDIIHGGLRQVLKRPERVQPHSSAASGITQITECREFFSAGLPTGQRGITRKTFLLKKGRI